MKILSFPQGTEFYAPHKPTGQLALVRWHPEAGPQVQRDGRWNGCDEKLFPDFFVEIPDSHPGEPWQPPAAPAPMQQALAHPQLLPQASQFVQ